MPKEVERKFIVINDSWKPYIIRTRHLIQAYISHRINGIVRIRINDDKAYLTIKGKTNGVERHEWEYEIPVRDAREMLANKICQGQFIEKTRYCIDYKGYIWEIDVFEGLHKGLIIAEIEISSPDAKFPIPPFIGMEVSHDSRYFNSNLNRTGYPFK